MMMIHEHFSCLLPINSVHLCASFVVYGASGGNANNWIIFGKWMASAIVELLNIKFIKDKKQHKLLLLLYLNSQYPKVNPTN